MRRLLLLLAILCVAGCQRRSASASAGSDKGLLSHEEAVQLLWRLPEISEWSRRVERRPFGRAMPVCTAEHTPYGPPVQGRRVWVFFFGESDKNRVVLWNRFEVDAATGAVRVWNAATDSYDPLEEWRRALKGR